MSGRARIRIVVVTVAIAVLVLFLFATGCKYLLNEYRSAVSKTETAIPSQSVNEARRRGALIEELKSSPNSIEVHGSVIAVGECWIEQASRPHPHYVWWERHELLDYYWLHLKLESGSALFADGKRLELRLSSKEFELLEARSTERAAAGQLVLNLNELPPTPILLTVRDRKNQEIAGRSEVGAFTLTKK